MTPLRERMIEDLRFLNRADDTIKCYVDQVARFAQYFGRSPEHLGPEDVRQYQLHLLEQKLSWSNFNLTGMMHLFVNLLRGKELIGLDRRLAGDWANLSKP